MALDLRATFVATWGHLEIETQRQNWRSMRKLAACLVDNGLATVTRFPANVLQIFHDWLVAANLSDATKGTHQNICIALFASLARNRPKRVSAGLDLRVEAFKRSAPPDAQPLSEALQESIKAACIEEIQKVLEGFELGQQAMDRANAGVDDTLGYVLLTLKRLGEGKWLTKDYCRKAGRGWLVPRMQEIGWHTTYEHLYLTPRNLFPFWLFLLLETDANPQPILEADLDCVIRHPSRDDFVTFAWLKKRAAAEQARPFSTKKEWSAYGVLMKLMVANENLREAAPTAVSQKLMLCLSKTGGTVPCVQLVHNHAAEFRKKHGLPHFVFKQARQSGAQTGYDERNDLEDSRRRLNHRNIRTTVPYVTTPKRRKMWRWEIVKKQSEFEQIARLKHSDEQIAPAVVDQSRRSTTVFGFDCLNPKAGLGPGGKVGEVCGQFHSCAGCSGAVVVTNNTSVVARLLKTAEHLEAEGERAKHEGWYERFAELYLPTLEVLKADLLPCVTDEILNEAAKVVVPPIPRLD